MPDRQQLWWRSLGTVCILGFVLGCGSEPEQPAAPETPGADSDQPTVGPEDPSPAPGESPTPESPSGPPVDATVEQLKSSENPQAKYDRKPAKLMGKVSRPGHFSYEWNAQQVVLTADGNPNVGLSGPFVTVLFPSASADVQRLRNLAPSQDVTVTGELRMASDDIWELHDAQLVEIGPDPTTAVSATELTKAFAEDAEAAAEKYTDKPLKVSGTVASAPHGAGQYAAVGLKGAEDADGKPTTVVVHIRANYLNQPGTEPASGSAAAARVPLKAGDQANFYGVLETRDFNEGPDGNPSLTVQGYLLEGE